jgi:hypothetical protein
MRRLPGQRRPGRGEDPNFVKHFDRDGDGKVSRAEFLGPAHHFDHFDRNRDGYLTDSEAPPPPPGRRPGGGHFRAN